MTLNRTMNWPHPVEAELHIVSELSRSGIQFKQGSKNIKLNCPFPHLNGEDRSLNLEITKDGRKAHCWVCNWSGSWNKLASSCGLNPFGSDYSDTYSTNVIKSDVFSRLGEELRLAFSEEEGSGTLPDNIVPWNQPLWRNLSLDFLSTVPSYLWKQSVSLGRSNLIVPRILWPYYQHGRLVGWSGRRLDKIKKIKYFRAPWCHASKILFPFDFVRERYSCSSVVLVEGEVDALNLIQAGIPALAILGTGSWGQDKIDLLLSLGVKTVFLLLDPDDAGSLARAKIKSDLSALMEIVVLTFSDDGDDPGNLDSEQLRWLKNRVTKRSLKSA